MTKQFDQVMRKQSKKMIAIFSEISEAASGNSDYERLESAYESLAVAAMNAKADIEASKTRASEASHKMAAIEIMKDLAVAGKAGSAGAKKLSEGEKLVALSVDTIQRALARMEGWPR